MRLYAPDVFASLWDRFEDLVAARGALTPREVVDELERGDDDCANWCTAQAGFVRHANSEVLARVALIANDFPTWVQGTKNYADPFVIAHAIVEPGLVVTQEQHYGGVKETELNIPNVCERYGVEAINWLGLMRREGWTF